MNIEETAKDVVAEVKEGTAHAVDKAQDLAHDGVEKVKEIGGDISEKAGEGLASAKDAAPWKCEASAATTSFLGSTWMDSPKKPPNSIGPTVQ